jgi:hypothetical protein
VSLNVFIGICVLACDFLIYAFFQWTFGEKYRKFRRTPKTAPKPHLSKPYIVATPERYRQTEREVA